MKKFCLICCLFIVIYSPAFCGENRKGADKWLGKDKFSHLISSTFIYCWHYEIFYNSCQMDREHSKVLSIGLTEFWGLAKEVYDSKQKNNHFSYKDLVFDTLGNVAASIICR
jgi:uncharacterized protein YfiM (DUF2279 family)